MYKNNVVGGSQEILREVPMYNFQLRRDSETIEERRGFEVELNNDLTGSTLDGEDMLIEEILNYQPSKIKAMGNITRRLSISEYHYDKPMYHEYEFFNKEGDIRDYLMSPTFSDNEQEEEFDGFMDYDGNREITMDEESSMSRAIMGNDEGLSMDVGLGRDQEANKVMRLLKLNKMFRNNSKDETDEPEHIFKKKHFWSRKPNVPIIKNLEESFLDSEQMLDSSTNVIMVNPSKLLAKNLGDTDEISLSTSSTKFSSLEPDVVLSSNSSVASRSNILDKSQSILMGLEEKRTDHTPHGSVPVVITKKQQGIPKTRGRKPSPILDPSKQFGCEFCDRRFKRQEHLKRHIRSLHMCEKPYGCHICGKKFSRSDNLNQHLKTHGNETK